MNFSDFVNSPAMKRRRDRLIAEELEYLTEAAPYARMLMPHEFRMDGPSVMLATRKQCREIGMTPRRILKEQKAGTLKLLQ